MAVTLSLYICLWKGSEQVNWASLWLAGCFNSHLMLSSLPAKIIKTVFSRCISGEESNVEVNSRAEMIVNRKATDCWHL